MQNKTIMLMGYGDIQSRMYERLKDKPYNIITAGRNLANHPKEAKNLAIDLDFEMTLPAYIRPDTVVYTPTPFDRTEAGYQKGYISRTNRLLQHLPSSVEKLVLVSSTRVYNGYSNSPISPQSAINPGDYRAEVLAKMEEMCLDSINTTIVRPSGIYGRGLEYWKVLLKKHMINDRWTNRIHADDLAYILEKVVDGTSLQSIIASDGNCVLLSDLLSTFAKKINQPFEQSQMADTPVRGNRIILSPQTDYGFNLKYPSINKFLNQL